MLKHVQISPLRNRSDSLSIRSTTSCASSLCGSPEPPSDQLRATSRASSYCSLNDAIPQVIINFLNVFIVFRYSLLLSRHEPIIPLLHTTPERLKICFLSILRKTKIGFLFVCSVQFILYS